MKAGAGRVKKLKGGALGSRVSRVGDIHLEENSTFSKEKKLDETSSAVLQVFTALDADRNGHLDIQEFSRALTQMDIILPVPVVNFIFNEMDADLKGYVTFEEFIRFVNDKERQITFDANYTAEFNAFPLGLELIFEKDARDQSRVFVTDIVDDARRFVLPGSEVIAIDGEKIADLSFEEVKRKIKHKGDMNEPLKILFKKESDKEKKAIGIMMGDEDWLVLSRHVSRLKLLERREAMKRPPVSNRPTPYCPDGDIPGVWGKTPSEDNWWVWIHRTFDDETYSQLSYFIVSFVMLLIFVSTLAYVLETIPDLSGGVEFVYIEWIVSLCFTTEYLARILTSRNAWIYFFGTMNLIDFLAVIPFWIELTFGAGGGGGSMLRVVRVIRLARVFRLLKSARFKDYLDIFGTTLVKSSQSAGLLVTLLSLQIVIFASLLYFAEVGKQDDVTGEFERTDGTVSPFDSIPAAAWWCIVTMTTVGYGDMYPTETLGMLIAVVAMFIGLFVIALPVIIIGGNFEETYSEFRKEQKRQERRDLQKAEGTEKESVEAFLDEINTHINLASGVQDVYLPFFTEADKTEFVHHGFDTRNKVTNLLRSGRHAVHFLPPKVPQYKLFVLYEIFGKALRDDPEEDKFAKVKKHLVSKIQML